MYLKIARFFANISLWRPRRSLVCMTAIIFQNYIKVPYIAMVSLASIRLSPYKNYEILNVMAVGHAYQ